MSVIPDSIEPVKAWRSWNYRHGKLWSLNASAVWEPGEALKATCPCTQAAQAWTLSRYEGADLATAVKYTTTKNAHISSMATYSQWGPQYIRPPKVEPPPGYGYVLASNRHDAPNERCTCGIYAATELGECPSGIVVGKVKLWGKVIPGERGYRAEYAYPSELYVPSKMLNDAGLLAYGVPLVERDDGQYATEASLTFVPPRRARAHWMLYYVIAANLAACAFNIVMAIRP